MLADIHSGLSVAYALLGEPALAARSYAANVAAYRALGHQVLAVMNQREELVCVVLPYQADNLPLRERATAAVEAATRRLVGAGTFGTMDPRYARLPLLILEGHWREARTVADVGSWNFYQPSHHLNIVVGPFVRAQGDRDLAWGLVREAWRDGPTTEPGDQFVPFTVPLLLLGAALSLDEGDLDEARAWLDGHSRWLDWMGATLGRSEGQALEAEWWRASGDPIRAQEHAERALHRASAPRQPLALLAAHRLLGSLEADAGLHESAEHHFAAALAIAEACRAPYEQALILLAQVELASASGDRATAASLLHAVRDLGTPLEARPLLDRVDALSVRLIDNGGGTASVPPLRSTPLPAGLSQRETEVLRLVTEGLTNPQIAERLFLSPKTVGSHLHSIFGKLGVPSRAAATRVALELRLV